MSKVGIYVILRLSSLFFGQDDGAAAGFADTWLTIGGLATIAYGLIGVLSSKTLTRVAGYYVLISSGRSEEHTSELQSLMRISSAVFCLKKTQLPSYTTKTNE